MSSTTEHASRATCSTEAVPIECLETSVFSVPTEEPEADGTFAWDETTAIVVEARGGGACGVGYTYGSPACAEVVRRMLAEVVVGRSALDVEAAWSAMVAAVRNAGRPGVVSMAIAAVDTALWDLKARIVGVALTRLLGALQADVPAYGSGGFTSMSESSLEDQLVGWVDEGMTRVKMKVGTAWGRAPERDLERVMRIRKALGDRAELFVDANGAYPTKQAARLGRRFDELGVTWFEEPVSSDHLESLAILRRMLGLDVTAGEYGYDLAYFAAMCGAGAVDVVQADVTRCGGFTEWRRIAALAAAHGLPISAHGAPSLAAQVAASVPNLAHIEYFADHVRVERLLFDGLPELRQGALWCETDRVGSGLELRRADADRFRVAP